MTRRLSTYVGMASLAVAGLMVAGCGSSVYTPPGPTNRVSGTTTQSTGTTTAVTVPPTGGASTMVTVAGNPVTAIIPSGAASPTDGQPVALIRAGSQPLSGTFTGGSSVGVNGVTDSGITVNSTGTLLQDVALPVDPVAGTYYSLVFPGGSVQGRSLTVGGWIFDGKFYFVGGSIISPLPTGLTGIIPNDGEDPTGSWVQATFGAGNAGRTATLTIYYSANHVSGVSISQTVTISSANVAEFRKLSSTGGSIPSTGVDTIALEVGDRN